MDDEQFLMDMIASGSAAAAGHANDTGDGANTDIYLNMSGGDEIDQPTADADDQETNDRYFIGLDIFVSRLSCILFAIVSVLFDCSAPSPSLPVVTLTLLWIYGGGKATFWSDYYGGDQEPLKQLRSVPAPPFVRSGWLSNETYLQNTTLSSALLQKERAPTLYKKGKKKEVECYSREGNRWMTCPRLKHVKGSLAMTMLNDKIFAIGEGVGSAVFSEDEMFDPTLGRWMDSLSMQQNAVRRAPADAPNDAEKVLVIAILATEKSPGRRHPRHRRTGCPTSTGRRP
ncbi:uncharacterized protein LOC120655359 [Panicum virgatum]|uniref:uncharacterized protein LOC120655359 n=1 Tax=Panicum virgatum TaxID=38727 RepID=UPI0019D653BF|nr:uncharacterized protein LOC120655359 [Panicum virgatum]